MDWFARACCRYHQQLISTGHLDDLHDIMKGIGTHGCGNTCYTPASITASISIDLSEYKESLT
jgi:hypothetical protein